MLAPIGEGTRGAQSRKRAQGPTRCASRRVHDQRRGPGAVLAYPRRMRIARRRPRTSTDRDWRVSIRGEDGGPGASQPLTAVYEDPGAAPLISLPFGDITPRDQRIFANIMPRAIRSATCAGWRTHDVSNPGEPGYVMDNSSRPARHPQRATVVFHPMRGKL